MAEQGLSYSALLCEVAAMTLSHPSPITSFQASSRARARPRTQRLANFVNFRAGAAEQKRGFCRRVCDSRPAGRPQANPTDVTRFTRVTALRAYPCGRANLANFQGRLA